MFENLCTIRCNPKLVRDGLENLIDLLFVNYAVEMCRENFKSPLRNYFAKKIKD